MATFKNTSMPARSTLPMRSGGSSRILKPLIALLALLIVAGASVATTWMITTRMQRTEAAAAPAAERAQAPQGAQPVTYSAPPATPPVVPAPIFVPLDPFTVTVQDTETERILHVGITLRVSDEQSRERIEKYLPEVRSRIVMLLTSLQPKDIQSSQGKVDLASAITASVNKPFAPLPDGQYVTDVLFTAFVVQ